MIFHRNIFTKVICKEIFITNAYYHLLENTFKQLIRGIIVNNLL